MKQIQLPSGFTYDYTHMVGDNAICASEIEALADQIKAAMEASEETRKTGVVRGHLSKDGDPELVLFPQLPYVVEGHLNSPNVIERLHDLGDYAEREVDAVVSFGIGGSFLGGKVLFDVHCGEFWNSMSDEERNNYPRMYFSGNNVDPFRTAKLIDELKRHADEYDGDYKVLLVLISKSGSTIEPMSNFMIVEEALKAAHIDYEVIAVTDPRDDDKETLLHKLATEKGWPMFAVPDGVGGRFSVFTEVGLIVGALVGFDIDGFLEGAKAMDQACQSSDVWQNPALLSAALKYIGSEKHGRNIEVMMPYGDVLKSLSEWYVQLLAESLGKHLDSGEGYYGRTPVVAVGTTDMHAQTQEHQEGRKNKVVSFVEVKGWDAKLVVPNSYDHYAKLEAFSGLELGTILHEALMSNAESLASDDRFSGIYQLPSLNAFHLGEFMFMCCWAIYFEGQLAGVDAFNQPGVEVYKKLLGPKLAAHKK